MRVTAIANCCSMGAVVQQAMEDATAKEHGGARVRYDNTRGNPDPEAELANISSLSGWNKEKALVELEAAEKDAYPGGHGGYISGAIAILNVQIGPMVEALKEREWLPLINWPGGHGGTCTLWFKQVKYLDGKPYSAGNSAYSTRRRKPEVMPEWCKQEQKDGSVK